MRKLSEVTLVEARQEAAELRDRRREARRIAAPLLMRMLAELDTDEEEGETPDSSCDMS